MASYNLRTVLKMMGQNILNWVKSNCVNNLLSTATNLPLAAAQGKVLDEKIGQVTQSLSSIAVRRAYTWNQSVDARTRTAITLSKADIGAQAKVDIVNKTIVPLGVEAGTGYVQITPTGQNGNSISLLAHNISEKATINPILYYIILE